MQTTVLRNWGPQGWDSRIMRCEWGLMPSDVGRTYLGQVQNCQRLFHLTRPEVIHGLVSFGQAGKRIDGVLNRLGPAVRQKAGRLVGYRALSRGGPAVGR